MPKKLTDPIVFTEVREGYYELNIGPAIITFTRKGGDGASEVFVRPAGLGEDE